MSVGQTDLPGEDPCPQCPHRFGAHTLMMPDGSWHGWMWCPDPGCDCFTTISVADYTPADLDRARWAIAWALMHRDELELVTAQVLLREAGEPDNALDAILDSLPEHVQSWWQTNRNE